MTTGRDRASPLRQAVDAAREAPLWRGRGRVACVRGAVVVARLPGARVGDGCVVEGAGGARPGEVAGFGSEGARVLVSGSTAGIGPGCAVQLRGVPRVPVGDALLGRVLDATGRPIDGAAPLRSRAWAPVEASAPSPLERPPVARRMATGVRAIDALVPLGHGQRVGLFAGPGAGKSTLLGDMAAAADVDVVVAALVGERGREVREVLDGPLAAARARSIVVVASGDEPALLRARAALTATAIAERFRDDGRRVLLLVDSLTRYARALREAALAAGEAPARGGYPPSVFAALPKLVERAGTARTGTMTAVYTVLCEAGASEDVVADEIRGLLDGHVVLSAALAERGQWPAVDAAASLSRLEGRLHDATDLHAARCLRRRIVAYEERRELVVLGAYEAGGDPEADAAVAQWPAIRGFLEQPPGAATPLDETLAELRRLGAAGAGAPDGVGR